MIARLREHNRTRQATLSGEAVTYADGRLTVPLPPLRMRRVWLE